jgi:hypothetical protein
VEVVVLDKPDGNVIARGSYVGGPDYEFVALPDGQVYFKVVGDDRLVWAGPDPEAFRQIVNAWQRYQAEYRNCLHASSEDIFFGRMRREFEALGALPTDMPSDPEQLWSLLLFEAENGLG